MNCTIFKYEKNKETRADASNDVRVLVTANAPAVLNDLFFMLRVVADLYIPVLSEKTIEDIDKAMDARKKVIIFNKISHE